MVGAERGSGRRRPESRCACTRQMLWRRSWGRLGFREAGLGLGTDVGCACWPARAGAAPASPERVPAMCPRPGAQPPAHSVQPTDLAGPNPACSDTTCAGEAGASEV